MTAMDKARSTPPVPPVEGPRPPTAEVEVRVLGPVEVIGAARPFARCHALDLIVYLALHPRGAGNDEWAAALWPERRPAAATLHSTASVARRALGRSSDGGDHLPRSRLRLGLAPTVASDWDRFRALAGQDERARWIEAMALVRGRPFDGLRSSDWTVLQGFVPDMQERVVLVAQRLGETALADGDWATAGWAARRALRASPFDERLHRVLLRAADGAGNRLGVEEIMDRLLSLLGDAGQPPSRQGDGPSTAQVRTMQDWADLLHPRTLDLYRSITGRRERRGALAPIGSPPRR
jgi:DNA-binding SARP family transcriptional activator